MLEAALLVLLVLSVALAVGANVIYRSVVLRREIATRRVLGARRKDIVRMFLAESTGCISIGLIAGSLLALLFANLSNTQTPSTALFGTVVAIGSCGVAGAWLAARSASTTSLQNSGLFRGAPDRRGES